MGIKVKAKRTGWDGLHRWKEGQVFDWPTDRPLGSWVEVVDPNDTASKVAVADSVARAEHARQMREAMGGNIATASAELEKTRKELAESNARAERTTALLEQALVRLVALENRQKDGGSEPDGSGKPKK